MAEQLGVVVTGGAGGIGAAIVSSLAASGYAVGVLDLAPVEAAEGVTGYQVDISDYVAVEEAMQSFQGNTGPLYGLVNNAGWDEAKPFIDSDVKLWRKVIDINLYGPLNATHIALKAMVEAGRGRIVSIASDAGRVGSSGESVYSAAKGGIIALMKTLAREHARQGITFNSICPGPTDTPLLAEIDRGSGTNLVAALERAIPMKRLGKPEDYPALVEYFLSDAAGYVTGQTISVSGGLSMHG
ncbi:MAG: SDR family NAD(P)-dependent oxidoreductase [Pseudomonadales bacterium]|jgi:2-hydroxycyclohexanecarboxyl-CoA dehydrogenase|nr:SDR family NAD(P)-dependent oxidoreductase [Pseudomonadales bacterium]MDP6472512.1 SDR family NAD(P)-dependent oxidoreductase [Pseudomonadales bacterium]MDP6828677.1 SDR family NAD(P)-dependent oxidoreductase [Pseudomonadales bacterium]MDP6973093.1 SDR family NAD(P)-dependent oxidoreductase [Pseudomonadales bacterium]|tara:strand:+ start:482 stop:1207 length:726 start_codon:yes stop_codon:yes gene_type:complete